MGMIAGIILAFFYKDYGPPSNIGQWRNQDDSKDDDPPDDNPYWNIELDEDGNDRFVMKFLVVNSTLFL